MKGPKVQMEMIVMMIPPGTTAAAINETPEFYWHSLDSRTTLVGGKLLFVLRSFEFEGLQMEVYNLERNSGWKRLWTYK
jgi:hypothetical protein